MNMRMLIVALVFFLVGGTSAVKSAQNQFYASVNGVDNTYCTDVAPCRSIQHATLVALQTDAGNVPVYINIGAGTFAECVNVAGTPLNSAATQAPWIYYIGQGTSTVWGGCSDQYGVLIANQGSDVAVQNMIMMGNGRGGQSILYAQLGGHIEVFSNMYFTKPRNCIFFTEDAGSFIQIWDAYTVYGVFTAGCHASATTNSYVEWNPGHYTILLEGSESYTTAFFVASANGTIYQDGNVLADGGVRGPKYTASTNGVIISGVLGGCSNLPGDQPGLLSTGGQCQ